MALTICRIRSSRATMAFISLAVGVMLAATGTSTSGASDAPLTSTACGTILSGGGRVLSGNQPCMVAVPVGASFRVVLANTYQWSRLRVDRTSLVAITTLTAPSTGGLQATLRARGVGVVNIVATGDVKCPTGQMCPALARLWSLKVLVVTTPSSRVVVPLTSADDGRNLSLLVGDQITVQLVASGLYTWSDPRSTAPKVLGITRVLGSASLLVTMRALAPGSAMFTATGTPVCYPQCLMPSRLFRVLARASR